MVGQNLRRAPLRESFLQLLSSRRGRDDALSSCLPKSRGSPSAWKIRSWISAGPRCWWRSWCAAFRSTFPSRWSPRIARWPGRGSRRTWSNTSPGQWQAEELARRLREARVELAHFHCGTSFAWGIRRLGASPILRVREAGIRCLTTNHGFFSPLEGYCAQYRPLWMKLALFPAAWLSKTQLLGRLECEVAVSRHDERALRRWYWPRRSRIRQIYHSQLPPEPAAATGPRARRVLCVGTVGRRKGQPLLAAAFAGVAARFPEWELVFAGRIGVAEVWHQVEETIAAHGLAGRVRRVEGLDHAQIAELMRGSEIFVLPSLFEGLGLALQEALYHGCACISTRSGGPEDLIDDGDNGLLVRNENAAALAGALARLMSDEPLRARFRARGPLHRRARDERRGDDAIVWRSTASAEPENRKHQKAMTKGQKAAHT